MEAALLKHPALTARGCVFVQQLCLKTGHRSALSGAEPSPRCHNRKHGSIKSAVTSHVGTTVESWIVSSGFFWASLAKSHCHHGRAQNNTIHEEYAKPDPDSCCSKVYTVFYPDHKEFFFYFHTINKCNSVIVDRVRELSLAKCSNAILVNRL